MNKSKFLKKSLAMLLALMLVLAMIPLSASAAELPNMGSIYVNGSVVKLPEGNSGTMTVDIGKDDNSLTVGTNIDLSAAEYQVKLVAAIEEDGLAQYKEIKQGVTGTTFTATGPEALSRWAPEDVMTLEVYPIDDIDFNDMKAQYTLELNRTPYNTTTTLASVKEVESTGVYSIENSLADINATRKVKVTAAYDETGKSVTDSTYKIDVTADKSATVNGKTSASARVNAKDDSKFEVVSQSGNNTAEYIVETTYVDALTSFTVNGVAGVITDEKKSDGSKGQDDHMDTITVTLPKEAVLDEYGDVQEDPTFKVEYSVYAKTGTIEFEDNTDPDKNTVLTGAADYTFTGLGKTESFSTDIVATVIGGIKQTYKLNVVLEPDTDTSIDRVVIKTFDEDGKDQTNVNELGYPEGDAINVELPNNANRANSKVTVYTSTTVKSVSVAGVTKSSDKAGDYTDQDGLRIWEFPGVNLTSSKLITVTAQDNSIEDYTLTATLASVSKRPAIESFSIEDPDTGIVYSGTPNTNDVIELEKIPYMTTNIGDWVVRVTAADGTTVLTPKGYAIPSGQFDVYDITDAKVTDTDNTAGRITTIPTTGATFDVTATDKTDTDHRTYTVKVTLEEPGSGKTLDKLEFTSQKPAPGKTKLSDEVVFRAKDSDNTFTAEIDQSKKEIILHPALSLAQTGYEHIVTRFTPAEGGVAFFETGRDTNAYLTPLKITDDDDDKKNVTGTTIAEEQHAIALGNAGATKRVVVLPEKLAREVMASADKKIALATVEKYGTIYEVKVVPQEALTGAYLHTFKVGDVELKVSGNTISGTIPWSYTVSEADKNADDVENAKFAEFTLDKYAQMSSVNADEDDPNKIVPANFYSKGDINGDGTEDNIYSPDAAGSYENFKFVFVRGTDNSVEVYQANEGGLSDAPISVVVQAEDRLNNDSVTSETYHFDLEYQAPERNANIDSFKLGKYDGTISDTDITVRVPYNTDVKGMIATFTTSTGAKVYYNGDKDVPVKSGETVLNYSSPVKLVVHSEKTIDDDPEKASVTVKTYTVTVVEAEMFSDVSDSKWYYDYVLEASDLGIINGKGDGIFAPEEDVTRGDFAVMLTNMLGVSELPHVVNNPFADVNEDIYYSDAIAYCYYQGYIGGYPDGSYRPEATITRQEAAKIIAEALELTETDDELFTDDNLIHEWAEDYVYQCKAAGIFGGDADTGNFRPTDAISRAETAKIMVVAYNNK